MAAAICVFFRCLVTEFYILNIYLAYTTVRVHAISHIVCPDKRNELYNYPQLSSLLTSSLSLANALVCEVYSTCVVHKLQHSCRS